jgi:hypothetical protein
LKPDSQVTTSKKKKKKKKTILTGSVIRNHSLFMIAIACGILKPMNELGNGGIIAIEGG